MITHLKVYKTLWYNKYIIFKPFINYLFYNLMLNNIDNHYNIYI